MCHRVDRVRACISIHALLAESDAKHFSTLHNILISIHALLAESDFVVMLYDTSSLIFLSTLSLRRATALGLLGWLRVLISIHALLAESDPLTSRTKSIATISIHALLAESDDGLIVDDTGTFEFLSTLSLRRATCRAKLVETNTSISIHALLAESDGFA